jgi:hypothetical protein
MAREIQVTLEQGDDATEGSAIASAIAHGNIHVLIDACDASEIRVSRSVE